MIYVHRDLSKIPQEKLDALRAISTALQEIQGKSERKAFIEKNKDAWSSVRNELTEMSFDKCWYTESREAVSRYQTDHFRPHGRAKQAEKQYVAGYCWLAFDIDNFRIVGVLANTQNKEYSAETVGKGDWFPLLEPQKRATLTNRSLASETPILLDPTDRDDPSRIIFNDNGEAHPSDDLGEDDRANVDLAILRMGIRQEQLNRKRRAKWRDCARKISKYNRFFKKPKGQRTQEEAATMDELAAELITMASCRSEFSATVRCCLQSHRLDRFAIRDELNPLVDAD
ncbi:hypothetical protein FE844_023210 [Rhizobium indicum]|uniref:hypothetical protein n=1 Tax=Rhizobium indicum TaxID=2583231 RepID=UPI001106FE73|nr:hypothetical protein [Rhizobium indicum]QKK32323.1 hypothetical protein FE844_023210 [Rhizobium indicum]